MKNWQLNSVPVIGIILLLVGWKLMYPWLGYMLDSDAVGYLTVAERVANGDFFTSVNSLWSPLNSWLLLIYSHLGMNYFFRAQVWNLCFGGILLIQSWWLMGLMQVKNGLRLVWQTTLSLIMIYLVYYQIFADLLQCVFIMTYLIWILKRKEKHTALTSIIAGAIMGIGFYAKAYTWFFFVIHFFTVQAIIFFNKHQSIKQAIKNWTLAVLVSLLFMSPWVYLIHQKFHVWSITGLAGKLNMSWYINSGKTFNDSIHLLIPPTYPDSPSFWEDPYLSQGNLTSPLSSFSSFYHWLARCIHTSFTAISCYAELSCFSIFILIWGLYFLLWKKKRQDDSFNEQLIILALLVLPIGYLTMHIETRYVWLSIFLLPIVFDRFLSICTKKIQPLLIAVWAFSFLVFPLLQIEELRFKNKDLFEESTIWKKQLFTHQSFTSSAQDEGRMWVLSYLTKSQYYTIEASDFSEKELIAEMKRYNIKWFLQEKQKCNDGLHFEGNEHWTKRNETSRFVFYELMP